MTRVDWFITELDIRGGAENFVLRAAPLLREYGWDLRIITLQKGGDFLQQLVQQGIPCVELNFNVFSGTQVLAKLNQMWSNSPPVILHTHLFHAGMIGRILAKKARIPIVVVHQHGLESNRSQVRSIVDRITSRWVTQYAVSCKAVSAMLQTRERIPASIISVIYNGVLVSQAQEASIRNSHQSVPFDQVQKTMIIGNVGRLEPEKGHEDLLQAFARLTNENASPPQLWILGDGSLRDRLVSVTKELGIQNQVHFWGAQKNVAPFLDKIDIFILPSRWEGLSMALLEAMSRGIPVIATEVGGNPEIIQHEVHGLLIPAGDPGAITEAIEFLRNNPTNRRKLGIQGQQHVIENYSLEKTVCSIDQLYKGLLS